MYCLDQRLDEQVGFFLISHFPDSQPHDSTFLAIHDINFCFEYCFPRSKDYMFVSIVLELILH